MIFADEDHSWSAAVSKAVRRPDGMLLEMKGVRGTRTFHAECNLQLVGHSFRGAGVLRQPGSKSGQIDLNIVSDSPPELELEGTWHSEGDRDPLSISLELIQADAARGR
jgi:hypothetical protein